LRLDRAQSAGFTPVVMSAWTTSSPLRSDGYPTLTSLPRVIDTWAV